MISFKNVTIVDTKLGTKAVDNLTIDINQGDFVVVKAESERVKNLVCDLFGCLMLPSAGEIYVDGIELSNYSEKQLVTLRQKKFGYITSATTLEDYLTVFENIELPLIYSKVKKEDRKGLVNKVLSIVGMQNFKEKRVNELTYWQQNKVILARTIVKFPSVLILNEPCKDLNRARLDETIGLLSALNKEGLTIVVATSVEDYALKAKRILTVSGGKFVETVKTRKRSTENTTKKSKKKNKKEVNEEKITEQQKIEVLTNDTASENVMNDKKEEGLVVDSNASVEKNAKTKQTKKVKNVLVEPESNGNLTTEIEKPKTRTRAKINVEEAPLIETKSKVTKRRKKENE